MPVRDKAPVGAPCWTDLWTSDVDGSRKFYGELFGWKASDPDPQYGGYFTFDRDGVPVAGAMGDMGDMAANNTWKIYLATKDVAATLAAAEGASATTDFPAMAVGDLGMQSQITDPTGASVGLWQPGIFEGFTVLGEQSAPSWFELHTHDYRGAVSFYESVFGWTIDPMSDTDEFRYSTVRDAKGDGQMAGIADASSWYPESQPSHWVIYWHTDDIDATVAKLKSLGGTVIDGVDDTPYGRMATVTDPAGARFKLHTPNA